MYNAEAFVKECIDSILSQTFKDFEILIVDDGSTDKSLRIIESHKDARIRIIKNKHDYISSLNILLSEAKGKYIARMEHETRHPSNLTICTTIHWTHGQRSFSVLRPQSKT